MNNSKFKRLNIQDRKPIDLLFDKAVMKCTLCNKKMGICDCWTKCKCGWSYKKGTKCNNPECTTYDNK